MKKWMFLLIPFALACGDAKLTDGETYAADDDCESGHCHIEADAEEGVCEAAEEATEE